MQNRFDSPKCPLCGNNVYFAEEIRAMNRAFHKQCFKCCKFYCYIFLRQLFKKLRQCYSK